MSKPSDIGAEGVESLRRTLAREREKLRALQDIGLALGSTLQLDELLGLVVERISEALAADRTTIYLLDHDTNELVSKVAQGSQLREIRMPIGRGIAGTAASSGTTLNIGYRTQTILCVPMRNQIGRIIGVVQCLNRRDGVFGPDDEHMLSSLASEAAVSIENTKLFMSILQKNIALEEAQDQLEQKVRELDVLFEIARVAATSMDLDDLLEGVLERAMPAIEAEASAILIADETTGALHFRAAVGGEPDAVMRHKIAAGEGISGWVAKHGQPQIVNDVDLDARHSRAISECVGYRPRSVLCVPLRWDGGVGALELLNKRGGTSPFTEDDLKLATVIAQNVSSAIQTAESRAKQRRQERLSTIGHFLSGVLHDLKSPMTVISGYVRVMASEDDREKRELLADKVLRQVHMLNTMTRETLAFARGERRLWVRRVYLYKFFEELEETLGPLLEERGVRLEVELKDRGTALFDEEKMIRVMHNLVRNAAEALGDRGGTVKVVVDKGPDGGLKVDVVDNGPGIPAEVRGRLFESFTTAGKKKGTGLGLAIVKSIVDDHRGTISVESMPGRTVFSITIPPMQPSDETDASVLARAG